MTKHDPSGQQPDWQQLGEVEELQRQPLREITGGQDNVQGVVGQMLTFFAELGCQFPQHPFIAHSRGWSAEDMENNIRAVEQSTELREGARGLSRRCLAMAELLLAGNHGGLELVPGGRKAHRLKMQSPGGE